MLNLIIDIEISRVFIKQGLILNIYIHLQDIKCSLNNGNILEQFFIQFNLSPGFRQKGKLCRYFFLV